MSKAIAKLLDQPHPEVAGLIETLESKNGYPSHDVRQIAESIQASRLKIADLGLDSNDTTAEELHHSLLVKFERDNQQLETELGVLNADFETKAKKAVVLASHHFNLPDRWVLKTTAAKKLLKSHPPKKLMKQLNYRSVDSMIKRQPAAQLSLAAALIESAAWKKAYAKLVSALDSTCFELRPVQLGVISVDLGIGQPLAYSEETGYLAIIKTGWPEQTPLLSMMVALADALGDSGQAAKLSPALAWWSDTAGLLANLPGGPVSLSLADLSQCSLNQHSFDQRPLANGRASFWHNLVNRYENQLQVEEDLLSGLKDQVVNLKPKYNQPAFEYAEEING